MSDQEVVNVVSKSSSITSPLYVASQRLRERKENVAEQLRYVNKFVNKLCQQRSFLMSKLDEECSSVEDEFELMRKTLENKRVAVLEELTSRAERQLEAISGCTEVAGIAISKTKEVREYCIIRRGKIK